MLPDFVSLKRELCEAGDDSLRSRFDKDPIFSLIATYRHHEGNRFTIVRADGSHETKHYREYKAEFTVDLLDVQARGEKVIRQAVAAAETEMIDSTKKLFFEEMSATIKSVGNSIDAKGQPITAELMLETYERMEFDFDDDGNWNQPTNVIHPVQASRFKAELDRLDRDPVLRERFDALIRRKRVEWNVQEANRKLVD